MSITGVVGRLLRLGGQGGVSHGKAMIFHFSLVFPTTTEHSLNRQGTKEKLGQRTARGGSLVHKWSDNQVRLSFLFAYFLLSFLWVGLG